MGRELTGGMSVGEPASARLSVSRFAGSEAGAWSNSYLVSGDSQAVLFDVVQLRSDAVRLAETIERSGSSANGWARRERRGS